METPASQRTQTNVATFLEGFFRSLNTFLKETGLHGLKFVGDTTIGTWERLFFLSAFIGAFVTTCHLISNIYAKWNSTPVIIGISPHATSIMKVPFPAVTICNMNQVQRSLVANYTAGSAESEILSLLCNVESNKEDDEFKATMFKDNNLTISDFVSKHSQPCSKMLLYCRFSSIEYNCSDLFTDLITDEGLCCVFNLLPPEFLFKPYSNSGRNLTNKLGYVPVKWDPEDGYPSKLPPKYLPRTAIGTGITLGFSIVLDAQVDEYYCSSTSGPGFKVFFHNPIEVPNVKEAGLLASIGFETNFRLEVVRSEAVSSIRSISREDRQCIFKNEEKLLYYKLYTRLNCENECLAKNMFETCGCIAHHLPQIYKNSTVCTVKNTVCINLVLRSNNKLGSTKCNRRCLPGCFDLKYLPSGFSSPLATDDFIISNKLIASMNKTYSNANIGTINLYYRESVYHGDMKNVYVGLTEFLSNIGGVMGLFMGFSFISLAEMLYFFILKPTVEFISKKRSHQVGTAQPINRNGLEVEIEQNNAIWHTKELYPKSLPPQNAVLISKKSRNAYATTQRERMFVEPIN